MTAVIKKERPILFSGPMVRAILAGQKTVTRRVADFSQPSGRNGYWPAMVDGVPKLIVDGNRSNDVVLRCPYGIPCDRLWVREPFYPHDGFVTYMADCLPGRVSGLKFKPSIHMPRKLSRINLEIVSVGVERVQDISREDVLAEGTPISYTEHGRPCLRLTGKWLPSDYMQPGTIERGTMLITDAADFERAHFASLWDSINHERGFGWAMNPWVWSVRFKRVKETR